MKTPLSLLLAALWPTLAPPSAPAAEPGPGSESGTEASRPPLFETFDLDTGDSVETASGARVALVSVSEPKGEVWGEISRPEVTVSVDGESVTIVAGMYRLPVAVGGVQIDCPITGGLKENSHINHWGLEKDARLRVWPGDSTWIDPGTFEYPVAQKWFASHTAFSNEPVAPRPDGRLYYHAGLDIGGCEKLTEVVAATDALVVSAGNRVLPGHEAKRDTPVRQRYDVLYLLDDRGWYYRYSHLDSFDPAIRAGAKVEKGQRLGLLGKEGGSGGWTHLHFEIKSRQPSGKWGTQDGYAFLWQGYRERFDPELLAVARPGHVVFVGDTVTHDGSRSWSRDGEIDTYQWRFSDGTAATGAEVRQTYQEPGTFMETLEVAGPDGGTDYDFVRVKVFSRDENGDPVPPPRVHAAYHPTFGIRPGEPVTFKARAFGTTHGEETWDFGDGSPVVKTRSDGNVEKLAEDGYAVVEHVFEKPGDYLVHVWRTDEHDRLAEDRLHVRVETAP
ncbi:MAG: PKD domain-containing protein [Verrucomicrobiales bacterium]